MPAFPIIQLLIPLLAFGIVVRQLRRLSGPGALHGGELLGGLREAAARRGRAGCVDLAHVLREYALGRVVLDVLCDDPAGAERRQELRSGAFEGVLALRSLGRLAMPLAFLGGILELSRAFGGGGGLLALQKGLAERLALQSALLCFTVGLGTSVFCFAAATLLRARGRRWLDMLDRIIRFAEDPHEVPG